MIFLILMLSQTQPYPYPYPRISIPCSEEPGKECIGFNTIIGPGTRSFTEADFGKPFNMVIENPSCEGFWVRGSLRYFTNRTAPSSLVGTLYPSPPPPPIVMDKPHIHLHSREDVFGWRATQANAAGAEVRWECSI